MPKLILPQALVSLFEVFAPCFTKPGCRYFVAIFFNFMAGSGRRTVARACAHDAGDMPQRHWTSWIRWLSRKRADRSRPSMAQVLLDLLLSHLPLPTDSGGRRRLYIPVDETRVQKSKAAKKMDLLHYWFNPQGGNWTGRYIWGHLWAILGVLLPIGDSGRLRCLPITAGMCRPKAKEQAQRSKNDISCTNTTFFRLLESVRWPADCVRTLIGDGAFACKALLDWCREHGFFLISHVKLNADVREVLPPQPATGRKRGRPRKWGPRIDLREVFDDDSRFEPLPKPLYEQAVPGKYASFVGLLKRSGDNVRIVLVKTERHKPFAIICTDLFLSPLENIYIYTDRVEIEIAIRELKDETGFGDYQVQRQHSTERHAQICIVACALLKLLRTMPQLLGAGPDIAAQTLPWQPARDSFSTGQVRTLLQQACMAEIIFRVLASAGIKAENNLIQAAMREADLGKC